MRLHSKTSRAKHTLLSFVVKYMFFATFAITRQFRRKTVCSAVFSEKCFSLCKNFSVAKYTHSNFFFLFQSLHHTNGGHSSYVTRVEFLADDSRIISTGGRDTAIMQWNLS